MIGKQFPKVGLLLETALNGPRAAGVEIAAHWRVGRAGNIPLQNNWLTLGLGHRIWDRDRREKSLRVGMLRVGVDVPNRPQFHDLPQIHDGNSITDMTHHAEVMRDEQIGQAEFILQVFQEVDHLGLDRHVKGRDRLIGNDEGRVQS